MTQFVQFVSTLMLGSMLIACGTDTSTSTPNSSATGTSTSVSVSQTGGSALNSTFSLRVTDAPVDDAAKVVISFTGARIRDTDGNWTTYTLDEVQPIDLLKLHGTATEELLQNVPAAAGSYDELRLFVDTTPMANYVELSGGGVFNLEIPSGSSSGLKLKGDFTISSILPAAITLDFDLRQSVKVTGGGKYKLKPVIRVLNDDQVGHIRGEVDVDLLTAPCSDTNPATFNAAYVFSGHGVTPSDIDSSSDVDVEPVTTTSINLDSETGKYVYEAAFLPAGDYTIALTCNSNLEILEAENELMFFNIQDNVTVIANDTKFL